MILWLILAAITLVAVAVLLLPLLRRPAALAPRRDYDLSVYRQQLAEIDRDLERGVLSEAEAGAARTEIERRMLQAADQAERPGTGGGTGSAGERNRILAAVTIAALLPVIAFLAYLRLGAPQLADREAALEALPPAGPAAGGAALSGLSPEQIAEVEGLIARLAERAKARPDDLQAWLRLGRAYSLTGRTGQAVEAFREAVRISGKRPDIAAEYGESLVMLHDGQVLEPARELFAGALAAQPREPRARYYLGLAAAQDGDWRAALERWTALAEDSSPDAPWLPSLRERLAEAAQALGRDPASLPIMAKLDRAIAAAAQGSAAEGPAEGAGPGPGPGAGGGAGQGAGQSGVGPAQIEAMVAKLAARLEAAPDDLQGWLMLLRSYRVLGKEGLLAESLQRARAAFAARPEARAQIERLAGELGLPQQPPEDPPQSQ